MPLRRQAGCCRNCLWSSLIIWRGSLVFWSFLLIGGLLAALVGWVFYGMSCSSAGGEAQKLSMPTEKPETPENWREWPIASGQWDWRLENGLSIARFDDGLVSIACDMTHRQVTLSRRKETAGRPTLTFVTTNQVSRFEGIEETDRISVTLDGDDEVLDAVAFSRGRFALLAAGHASVSLPSWPEINRIIEDCR